MPRVTVYIPAYNHERFVGAAIRSVLEQTCGDFELIVADDASTDGTLEAIRKHHDPRMRVLAFPRNRGTSAIANDCIREAVGEFVCPLSSDDLFHPEKLRRQLEFLDAHPAVLAVTAAPIMIDEEGRLLEGTHSYTDVFTSRNRTKEEWLEHFFIEGCNLAHTSMMVRRKAYAEVGAYHHLLRQSPDLDFFVRLFLHGEVHVLEEPLSFFRVRSNDQNVSAPRPATIGAMQLELTWVLKRYLHPWVLNNLAGIFGEEWGHPENEIEARLTLAEIAWSVRNPAHRTFAAQLLFDTSLESLDASGVETFRRRARAMLGQHDVFRFVEAGAWREQKLQLRQQKQQLKSSVASTRAKLVAVRSELDEIKQSLVWKLAKPLRALKRALRRPQS